MILSSVSSILLYLTLPLPLCISLFFSLSLSISPSCSPSFSLPSFFSLQLCIPNFPQYFNSLSENSSTLVDFSLFNAHFLSLLLSPSLSTCLPCTFLLTNYLADPLEFEFVCCLLCSVLESLVSCLGLVYNALLIRQRVVHQGGPKLELSPELGTLHKVDEG